jgi:hypothetical protein
MGTGGRNEETTRAVDPLLVKVRISGALRRRAASAVAAATARSVGVIPSTGRSRGMS